MQKLNRQEEIFSLRSLEVLFRLTIVVRTLLILYGQSSFPYVKRCIDKGILCVALLMVREAARWDVAKRYRLQLRGRV